MKKIVLMITFFVSSTIGLIIGPDNVSADNKEIGLYIINQQDDIIIEKLSKTIENLIKKNGEKNRQKYIETLVNIQESQNGQERIYTILGKIIKKITLSSDDTIITEIIKKLEETNNSSESSYSSSSSENSYSNDPSENSITGPYIPKSVDLIYYRGPRGGCYYYNKNGNKTYVARSLCN